MLLDIQLTNIGLTYLFAGAVVTNLAIAFAELAHNFFPVRGYVRKASSPLIMGNALATAAAVQG